MWKKSFLLSLALAISTGADALASEQTYTIENFPSTENCHKNAIDFGKKFTLHSGIAISSSLCKSISPSGQTIEITYQSATPVASVTTDQSNNSINTRGFFAGKNDCENALTDETAVFETKTGLNTFVAYCYLSRYTSANPWILRIDGLGVAQEQPFQEFVTFSGSLADADSKTVLASITSALTDEGASLRYIDRLSESVGISEIGIFYYSTTKISFSSAELGEHDNRATCEIERQYSMSVFPESRSNLIPFCIDIFPARAELVHLNIGDTGLKYETSAEYFLDFSDCTSQKEATIAIYRDTLNRNIAGATCGIVRDIFGSRWRLFIFEL